MNTLEINGKTYKAKRMSALVVEMAFFQAEKMDELQKQILDTKKREEYTKLWLEYCDLFLEGDIHALDLGVIDQEAKGKIIGFFVSLAGSKTKTSPDGNES